MTIGQRLKEERLRLNYNQTDFSALINSTKKSQYDYENDKSSPTAKQLEILAHFGVDVLYVLTGERHIKLSSDEQEIVNLFQQAQLENKLIAVQALKGLLPSRLLEK